MIQSKYNFYLQDESTDICLIYNSFSNSLVEDDDRRMTAFLQNGLRGDITETEYRTLLENRMIVEDHSAEQRQALDITESRYRVARKKGSSVMSLLITPTMGCNFRCFYCFEPNSAKKDFTPMSREVQDDIVRLVEQSIKEGIKTVQVSWFGGEPLVEKDILIDLQTRIQQLCRDSGVGLTGNVITNGLLLDRETSDRLYGCGIQSVQITMDGPEKIHNRRRYYPEDPDGNFRTLVENMLNANENLRFVIRINVDKRNKEYVTEFIDSLYDSRLWPFRSGVSISVGHVICADGPLKKVELDKKEFLEFEDYIRHYQLEKYNESGLAKPAKLKFLYPTQTGPLHTCGYAAHDNSWVVDHEGNIYQCLEAVGCENLSVTTIKQLLEGEGKKIKSKNGIDRTTYEKHGCGDCNILPICNMICPWDHILSGSNRGRKCTDWKEAISYRLLNQYRLYKQNPGIFQNTPFVNE